MCKHWRPAGYAAADSLASLPTGGRAVILALYTDDRFRRRLLDLGFIPGTVVEAVRRSPGGDPVAVRVRGTVIALRLEDAARIAVRRPHHPDHIVKGIEQYADDR